MLDITGPLVVGAILSVLGFLAVARKHITLEFGRIGFFNPRSAFRVRLTEARALLFGVVSLGMGIILIGLALYLRSSQGNISQNQGILIIAIVLTSLATIFTFLVELLFEFLVWLKSRANNITS
jgi:hypothetical protein